MASKVFKNNLLKGWDHEGFPPEYILSRIHGKRTGLLKDYTSILYSPLPYEHLKTTVYSLYLLYEDIEYAVNRFAESERGWLFRLADYDLKGLLEPVLMLFELENLKAILRAKSHAHEKSLMKSSLGPTILKEDILFRLINASDIYNCINEILKFIPEIEKPLRDSLSLYKEPDDLPLIEFSLEKGLLEFVSDYAGRKNKELSAFFEFNIDCRNLRTAFKLMTWDLGGYEQFHVNGGRLKSVILNRAAGSKDFYSAISNLEGAYLWKIISAASSYLEIEHALDNYSLLFFRKLSRGLSGIGLIIDYLWRRHIEAKQLRLIFQGVRLGLAKEDIEKGVAY